MQLTTLEKVKVGSKIQVGGETYKVKSNWGSDLVLTNDRGQESYFNFLQEKLAVKTLGAKHLVVVSSEPQEVKVDLTAQLRNQLSGNVSPNKPSLTESLKAQVSGKSLTDSLKAQVAVGNDTPVRTSAPAQLADPRVGQLGVKVEAVNAKADTTRSQLAQVAVRANEANVKADAANHAAVDFGFAFEQHAFETDLRVACLEEAVLELDERIEEIFEDHDSEEISDLEYRISQLEDAEAQRGLQARLNETLANTKNAGKAQGGNTMKNLLSSFKNLFGKVEGQFALSLFGGIAIRKNAFSQEWVTYKEGDGITDVQGNVLKFDVPAFRLPVEPKAVKKGNIVVAQNGNYGYVTEVADGFVKVIFPATASQGTVLPIKNALLGKAFYTVVNVIDIAGGQTGGFNPTLLLALSGEGSKNDLLPLLLASGGLTGDKAGAIDPMMLMALGGNDGGGFDDILPLLLLQQGGFAKDGVNPLLFLAMSDKGGKGKDLLPILLATGGLGGAGNGAAGAMNPMMLMALMGDDKDGGSMKDIFMMQALAGGNLFGAPATPATEVKDAE